MLTLWPSSFVIAQVDAAQVQSWLSAKDLTIAGLLLTALGLVVLGLVKQWWVPGWLYKQERVNSAKWEALYLDSRRDVVRAGDALQQTVKVVERISGSGSSS